VPRFVEGRRCWFFQMVSADTPIFKTCKINFKMAVQIDKRELRPISQGDARTTKTATQTGQPPESLKRSLQGHNPANDYVKMGAKLAAVGRDPESLNALGVCHMRLGNVAEAVRIYRGLTLQPGCTWERADIPAVFKRNFATALLLSGLPGGCVSVLQSLEEFEHPRSRELFAAIKRWERSLSFIQRWDWRLNGVTPRDCRIPIDFEPGEFR
jgi:hypothetical protein